MFLFDEEKLAQVSAGAKLFDVDLNKPQMKLLGKGIDSMTDEEKIESFRHGFGGSTVPKLFGLGFDGPEGARLQYDTIVNGYVKEISTYTKRLFAQGHYKEEDIFEIIRDEIIPKDWKLEKRKDRYVDIDKTYLYIDIDALLIAPDGEKFLVEIKSYKSDKNRQRPIAGILGEGGRLNHDEYEWQVRYYLRELNVRAAVVFIGSMEAMEASELVPVVIYRDFNKEKFLHNVCVNFWENHVMKKIPPKRLVSDDDLVEIGFNLKKQTDALKEIYNTNNEKIVEGKVIDLPSDMSKKIYKILDYEEEIDALNSRVDYLKGNKNELLVELSDYLKSKTASIGYSEDCSYCVKRKVTKGRKGFDTKNFEKDYPDLYQEYKTVGSDSISYLVSEVKSKEG